jgi:parvulin-like peptidyl-prolyl isomerase
MIVQRVQQTEVMSKLQVTDAELKMYYDSHRDTFTSKPQITLRELLVGVPQTDQGVNVGLEEEAKAKAEDIRKRLLAGEPFARLAADLSDSPSKANGGLVGPLTADVLAPELQTALAPLKPGDLTPVLRTGRGFQLIKLETMEAVTVKTFDEARSDIAQRLSNDKRRAEFKRFIDRLRGQAIIDWKNADLKQAYELGLKNAAAELAASAVP